LIIFLQVTINNVGHLFGTRCIESDTRRSWWFPVCIFSVYIKLSERFWNGAI